LKPNFIGISGAIIAFISLVLPWWTMTLSGSMTTITIGATVSVYPCQATVSTLGLTMSLPMNMWYGWLSLAFIIIGALLAIVGSLTVYAQRKLLSVAVTLVFLSIVIFAKGLDMQLSELSSMPFATTTISGFSGIGLFSGGTINATYAGVEVFINYSSYLSFGFWLGFIAMIIIAIAALWVLPSYSVSGFKEVFPQPRRKVSEKPVMVESHRGDI